MTKRQKIYLASILVVGFILHLLAINHALPIRFFGDEYIHLANSLKMLENQSLFLDHSYLPLLYAYLLMPFILLYGLIGMITGVFNGLAGFREYVLLNSENLLILSRLIAAGFGALSVFIVFKWAKELFNIRVAYLSAIILTLSPLHLLESEAGRFWLPEAFFIFTTAYFLYRLYLAGEARWYYWTVIMIGLGFGMGFVSVVIIPWLLLVHYFTVKKFKYNFFNKNFISAILILSAIFIFFVLTNTYAFYRQFGRGWGTILSIFGITINVPQSSPELLDNNFIYTIWAMLKILWANFYLQLVLIIAGLGYLLKKKEYWQNLANYFLLLFPLVYLLGLAIVFHEVIDRYILPSILFLVIVAAYGLDALLKYFKMKRWVVYLFLFIFFLPQIYFITSYTTKLLKSNTYLQAKNWIEEKLPQNVPLSLLNCSNLNLTPSPTSINLQKENNPTFFSNKFKFLLTLPDQKYPQPNYYLYNFDQLDLQKINPQTFQSDYLVVCFMNFNEPWPAFAQNLLNQFQLQKMMEFYPTKPKYRLDGIGNASNSIVNSLVYLNKIDRLGPRIEIYKLIKNK